MRRHEEICFRNPSRCCYLCNDKVSAPDDIYEGLRKVDMPKLLAALETGIEDLRSASQNCPACMMAAILQRWNSGPQHENDYIEFDYKAALAAWRECKNDEIRMRDFYLNQGGMAWYRVSRRNNPK